LADLFMSLSMPVGSPEIPVHSEGSLSSAVGMATEQLDLNTVVARREQLVADLGDETMMVDESGAYIQLDTVGSRIWELLSEPRSVASVCDALESEFAVDRETCERDVLAFLGQMLERKLLRVQADQG
jgi:hypothetical protein